MASDESGMFPMENLDGGFWDSTTGSNLDEVDSLFSASFHEPIHEAFPPSPPAAFSPLDFLALGSANFGGLSAAAGENTHVLGNPSPFLSAPSSGECTHLPQKASTAFNKRGFITGFISEQELWGLNPVKYKDRLEYRVLEVKEIDGIPLGSNKKRRWIKSKGKGLTYTLGSDVDMNQVIRMSAQTLVIKAYGRYFSLRTVVNWVELNWKSHMAYAPKVVAMVRNWFVFHFHQDSHAKWALSGIWSWDHNPVILKAWSPMFAARRERIDTLPLWVRLPSLPLQFRTPTHLKNIGNLLGSFLEADLSFTESNEQKIVRILVNIYIRDGLLEEMNLRWNFVHSQILDYENIPF